MAGSVIPITRPICLVSTDKITRMSRTCPAVRTKMRMMKKPKLRVMS